MLREVRQPVPAAGEVLVRVRAAGVNRGDWHFLTGQPLAVRAVSGPFRPKRRVPGADVAGVVAAVGPKATRFNPGDAVFGTSARLGAFAEFMCAPEDGLVPKPPNVTDAEAAAVPTAALAALQGLRDKGRIQSGHRVLVNGAGGGVGTFAVQLAKAFNAEVTGVSSAAKRELVRALGADQTLDYAREDFTRHSGRYDLILDLVGNHPLADCKRALAPGGIYVAAAGGATRMLRAAMTGGKQMTALMSQPNQSDLRLLGERLETGAIRPVISRRYALGEVPEALRHIGNGHAKGKVVVVV